MNPRGAAIPLRVLFLGLEEAEMAELGAILRWAGFAPRREGAATEQVFLASLDPRPDLILSAYAAPALSAGRALVRLGRRPGTGYGLLCATARSARGGGRRDSVTRLLRPFNTPLFSP